MINKYFNIYINIERNAFIFLVHENTYTCTHKYVYIQRRLWETCKQDTVSINGSQLSTTSACTLTSSDVNLLMQKGLLFLRFGINLKLNTGQLVITEENKCEYCCLSCLAEQ